MRPAPLTKPRLALATRNPASYEEQHHSDRDPDAKWHRVQRIGRRKHLRLAIGLVDSRSEVRKDLALCGRVGGDAEEPLLLACELCHHDELGA